MLRGSPQSEIDRHTYVPPEVAKTLQSHFDQKMPGHLKNYVSSNSSGYVSGGMEKAISSQMKKDLPSYLKPYADAYVQQNIVSPITQSRGIRSTVTPPPTPDKLRRDHSMPVGEQFSVSPDALPKSSEKLFQADDKIEAVNNDQSKITNPYGFILEPTGSNSTKSDSPLSTLPPLAKKLLMVSAGLFIIIILFSVLKGVFSGGSNIPSLTSVAQDQTEILHIINKAKDNQQSGTTSMQNAISTLQIAVTSANNQIISYLSINGHKLSLKQLDLKISASTDQNIANAQTTGNYNQTLTEALSSDLSSYMTDIKSAYNQTKGSKGQALLKDLYNQTTLMQTQIKNVSLT